MLRVAIPVVLAELGWMAMGVVDTIMVGPLGPAGDRRGRRQQLAADGARDLRHGTAAWPRHARVARVRRAANRRVQSLVLARRGARLASSRRCSWRCRWLLLQLVPRHGLSSRGRPAASSVTSGFCCGRARRWSSTRRSDATCRRFTRSTPVMIALVTANLVNALGNWVFIYGHLGAPAAGPCRVRRWRR